MSTFRISAEVKEDRRIVLQLPPEAPTGKADVVVTVGPADGAPPKRPRSNLADWAEAHAEHWGHRFSSEDVSGFTGRRF
jgi:hypothetical protein